LPTIRILRPILDSIAPLAYSDKRIRKPAVRRSWLQKREGSDRTLRGREDFVEVDWDLALDLVAQENRRVRDRYGPSGLFHRFLWLVICRSPAPRSFAGAPFLFCWRRRRRSVGQLQLGLGAVFPAVCDRHFHPH
jgi:hypothetical protein